mmetsp:Transcript_8781/g.26634  ORF Transcript_8781/g.26634 Transcript_8781/m.26634 type:complete len:135 (-) Transcript_8781:1283-1687(-)
MQGMGMDNPKVQACLARQDENVYIQFWRASLFKTPCESPGYCCYAMWCPWCASFGLRKRALHGDMNRYQCCNGLCPCSGVFAQLRQGRAQGEGGSDQLAARQTLLLASLVVGKPQSQSAGGLVAAYIFSCDSVL